MASSFSGRPRMIIVDDDGVAMERWSSGYPPQIAFVNG
jgi:hypothetical protein